MRRVCSALASALLSTSVYATEFRTASEHLAHMGAGPEMMAQLPSFADRIKIYDHKASADFLLSVFKKSPGHSSFNDETRPLTMDADGICKVYSVTRAESVIADLEKALGFSIENKDRISGDDLALFVLFHEFDHCLQILPPVLSDAMRIALETDADGGAIQAIQRARPYSNIADVVTAFRSVHQTYSNAFMLEKKLKDEPTPDAEETLRSHTQFMKTFRVIAQTIHRRLPEAERDLATAVTTISIIRNSGNKEMRGWADSTLNGLKFFAPKKMERHLQIAARWIAANKRIINAQLHLQ